MIRLVSDSEFDVLHRQFNPPAISETFSEQDFCDEYWSCHRVVEQALEILGRHNIYGEGDFCMNDDYGHSRHIAVSINSKRLWRRELIPLIQSALKGLSEDYVVWLSHDDLDESEFHILVWKDRAAGYFECAQHQFIFE